MVGAEGVEPSFALRPGFTVLYRCQFLHYTHVELKTRFELASNRLQDDCISSHAPSAKAEPPERLAPKSINLGNSSRTWI